MRHSPKHEAVGVESVSGNTPTRAQTARSGGGGNLETQNGPGLDSSAALSWEPESV